MADLLEAVDLCDKKFFPAIMSMLYRSTISEPAREPLLKRLAAAGNRAAQLDLWLIADD